MNTSRLCCGLKREKINKYLLPTPLGYRITRSLLFVLREVSGGLFTSKQGGGIEISSVPGY
ncbi:MAG: hypothetical protein DRN40_06435 [Thermoplasmata archaeon]|nr:MAG: hypothetical protein DRN40_06435 [Thermoplasmata archaeon]RLF70554.1 MAG: hypothetical protein DRN55_08465 [Thermoplasmata archaeon]